MDTGTGYVSAGGGACSIKKHETTGDLSTEQDLIVRFGLDNRPLFLRLSDNKGLLNTQPVRARAIDWPDLASITGYYLHYAN